MARNGGLPPYMRQVARAIKKTGKTLSRAIAAAITRIRIWAAGGGGVSAKVKAKAVAALAEYNALLARTRASRLALAA